MSKYHSKRTEVDGIVFDSRRESRRYSELLLLEKSGEIHDLVLQPEFELIVQGGTVVGKYRADFEYMTADGERIVEDVKGVRTPVYRLKKKIVEAVHGIKIVEVA